MQKPVIALDLDDTLYEHFASLAKWHNATYGTALTLADNHPFSPRHWATKELQEATLRRWRADSVEQAVKRVHGYFDTDEFRSAQPFAEVKSVIQRLSTGYDLVVVTARDVFLEDFTRQWLQAHFGSSISGLCLTARYNLEGKARDKVDVLVEIGASFLIDDDAPVCVRASEQGVRSVVFGSYPWNQDDSSPEGVVRCVDWQAVADYFEDVGTNGASDAARSGFRARVESLVAQIPPGRVMTYGQLAALCGQPRAARIVGGIAHFGDPALPWQRVVNKQGGLAAGYPGGRAAHAEHLRQESVPVSDDYYVDVQLLLWWPDNTSAVDTDEQERLL